MDQKIQRRRGKCLAAQAVELSGRRWVHSSRRRWFSGGDPARRRRRRRCFISSTSRRLQRVGGSSSPPQDLALLQAHSSRRRYPAQPVSTYAAAHIPDGCSAQRFKPARNGRVPCPLTNSRLPQIRVSLRCRNKNSHQDLRPPPPSSHQEPAPAAPPHRRRSLLLPSRIPPAGTLTLGNNRRGTFPDPSDATMPIEITELLSMAPLSRGSLPTEYLVPKNFVLGKGQVRVLQEKLVANYESLADTTNDYLDARGRAAHYGLEPFKAMMDESKDLIRETRYKIVQLRASIRDLGHLPLPPNPEVDAKVASILGSRVISADSSESSGPRVQKNYALTRYRRIML